MLRTAMRPRFVRLFVVMVVLVVAFIWLGRWQWSTAHNNAAHDALARSVTQKPVELDELMKPQTEFDNADSLRPVTVTGHYDAAHTTLVAGRVLNGTHGWWLMTPLVADSTGARISIVRGFVTRTDHLPAPTSGTLTVRGALAPGESSATTSAPTGQIATIDLGLLLNQWGGSIYNGFIFQTGQSPAITQNSGSTRVTLVPPPVPTSSGLVLRNAAYALQWWIFAAFVVFVWVKQVREAHLDEQFASAESAAPLTSTTSSRKDTP